MKSLQDAIYQDRKIFCKGCPNRFIGEQKLDGQVLVLESGLIVFNYFSFQCPKGHNNSWLSPLLPDDKPTLENLNPDIAEISRKIGITKLAFDRYRVRIRAAGKEKYVGVFSSEAEAILAKQSALAKL